MQIERSKSNNRVYVTDPRDWATKLGTDYIWVPSTATDFYTGGTAGTLLSGAGWTFTSENLHTPTGNDFIASGDTIGHNGVLFDASGDIARSPIIFGDYNHARAAQQILGYLPTQLVCEVGADWTVASANETQSAFGFLEVGGTSSVANDHMAAVFSNATTFGLRSGAASDAGAAVDNAYHVWKIVVNSTNVTWYIDGTSQGTIALQAELWPVSFFAHTLTTNRFNLGWVHIYYA